LDSHVAHDEQKDLELESEELPNNEPQEEEEEEEQSATDNEEEQSSYSGLSSRASEMKAYLREKSSVKALLLKQDGSTEAIDYDASSSSTRSLLGGRPSIIGEIEELQVVAVQSARQAMGSGLAENKHTLPVPLCHNRGSGDYVLFRVDSEGVAVDVTLAEYTKYVEDHKTLTATAVKNHSNENEPIRSSWNSASDWTAKMSMESFRGALQSQLYSELNSESVLSAAALSEAVEQRLQEMMDLMVSELSGSPMDDPDYRPSEETMNESADLMVVGSAFDVLDERPWRMQLEGALEHIRSIGRADAEAFAERVISTIYELNGSEPSLCELSSLYGKIRTDFANEAEEESLDEVDSASESESESESEAEIESESESEIEEEEFVDDDEWQSALDHVRSIAVRDGSVLAETLISVYQDTLDGESPSLSELSSIWQSVHEEVAAEAEEEWDSEDEDADYDPENFDDELLEEIDTALSRQHDAEHFEDAIDFDEELVGEEEWEEAMDHIRGIAKEDGAVLAQQICDLYLEQNGVSMSLDELSSVWQWIEDGLTAEGMEGGDDEAEYDPENAEDQELAVEDADEDAEHEISHFDQVLLNTPMVSSKRGGAVSFSVYFDERELSEEAESSNLVKTASAFEMMHQRPPTTIELQRIRQFLSVPNELVDEEGHFLLNTPMASSKRGGGVTFSVYFDESELSEEAKSSNLVKTVDLFKKMWHREPTQSELNRMKNFLSVPCDLEDELQRTPTLESSSLTSSRGGSSWSIQLDESNGSLNGAKRAFSAIYGRDPSTSELDHLRSFLSKNADSDSSENASTSTKKVVTKDNAVGYTLNFDDNEAGDHDGDEEVAVQWFKRFNNRDPSESERKDIQQFMKANRGDDEQKDQNDEQGDEDMVDIE